MSDPRLVDKALLKTLVPPSALNAENFQELAGKAYIESVPAGKTIFRQGETDRKTVYLLEGEVALSTEQGANTAAARSRDIRWPITSPASIRRWPRPPARSPASTVTCWISS